MDTLRADRTSLCGYERPTTPTLERLREAGAAVACGAVAPGSWTLPSHASFFTGQSVAVHEAHFAGEGEVIRAMTIRPLDDRFETLAESMAARGYQTAGVSANPVLAAATGLDRGFAVWRVASRFGSWYGSGLIAPLRAVLRSLEPDRPLFLFVNVADAHDPWGPVPAGIDWLPETRPGLFYFALRDGRIDRNGIWQRYVRGEMTPPEDAALRVRVERLYDFAVHRADRTLAAVLAEVEAYGWTRRGMRLVVASDHGEFLGEHGLLRHGRYLYEGNNRVPLLVLDSDGAPALPDRLSALEVFALAREGRRPAEPQPSHAVAFPDRLWTSQSDGRVGGSTSAALWLGDEKLLWMDGETRRYDLARDPDERRPLAVGDHPGLETLTRLVEEVKSSKAQAAPAVDPELLERLRAAGYLE